MKKFKDKLSLESTDFRDLRGEREDDLDDFDLGPMTRYRIPLTDFEWRVALRRERPVRL